MCYRGILGGTADRNPSFDARNTDMYKSESCDVFEDSTSNSASQRTASNIGKGYSLNLSSQSAPTLQEVEKGKMVNLLRKNAIWNEIEWFRDISSSASHASLTPHATDFMSSDKKDVWNKSFSQCCYAPEAETDVFDVIAASKMVTQQGVSRLSIESSKFLTEDVENVNLSVLAFDYSQR